MKNQPSYERVETGYIWDWQNKKSDEVVFHRFFIRTRVSITPLPLLDCHLNYDL